jgi:hypothetical protein
VIAQLPKLTVRVRFSGLFTGTSPPLDEQPDKIVVGFLGKYRLHDFPYDLRGT